MPPRPQCPAPRHKAESVLRHFFRGVKSGLRDAVASFQGTSALESPRGKKKIEQQNVGGDKGYGHGEAQGPQAVAGQLPPGNAASLSACNSRAARRDRPRTAWCARCCRPPPPGPRTRGWKDCLHWGGCLCFPLNSPGDLQRFRHPCGLAQPSRCFAFLGYCVVAIIIIIIIITTASIYSLTIYLRDNLPLARGGR